MSFTKRLFEGCKTLKNVSQIIQTIILSRRVFGCDLLFSMLHVNVSCRRRGARNVGARVALAVFLWCSVDML